MNKLMRAGAFTATALLLAVVLGSCAWIHETDKPLAEIDPRKIRLSDDIRLAREGWPSARWWTHFDDPQLDALIERSLAGSPTIVAARTRVSQARAQVELVRAGSNLQVIALAAIDQDHVSSQGFLGPYALKLPLIGADGPWYTEGLVGLGASLDIDIWGKQRSAIQAAIGVQNAHRAEEAAIELAMSTEISVIYFGMQTNYSEIGLLKESKKNAGFSVETHAARAARGLEAQTQTEQARTQLLSIDLRIAAANGRIQQFREALRALVGAGADDFGVIKPVPLPEPRAALPATLSYELLARRPDLQALRWYVESSLSRVEAAKAAFYPSFDIKAFFGFNALRLTDLFAHGSQQINIIPGLDLPIFDGGRLNANLRGAATASNILVAQYNQAVLDAVRDVAIAGSRLQEIEVEKSIQNAKIDAARFAQRSAEAHYERGLADRLVALQARQPVFTERMALLDLQSRQVEEEIALVKALGGGYRSEVGGEMPTTAPHE
jgi:outer membrane protein, multidrug efflux system